MNNWGKEKKNVCIVNSKNLLRWPIKEKLFVSISQERGRAHLKFTYRINMAYNFFVEKLVSFMTFKCLFCDFYCPRFNHFQELERLESFEKSNELFCNKIFK